MTSGTMRRLSNAGMGNGHPLLAVVCLNQALRMDLILGKDMQVIYEEHKKLSQRRHSINNKFRQVRNSIHSARPVDDILRKVANGMETDRRKTEQICITPDLTS